MALKKNVIMLGVLVVAWTDVVLDVLQAVDKRTHSMSNCEITKTSPCVPVNYGESDTLGFEEFGKCATYSHKKDSTTTYTCHYMTFTNESSSFFRDAACTQWTATTHEVGARSYLSSRYMPISRVFFYDDGSGGAYCSPYDSTKTTLTYHDGVWVSCRGCQVGGGVVAILIISLVLGALFQFVLDARLYKFLFSTWNCSKNTTPLRHPLFYLFLPICPIINIFYTLYDCVWNRKTHFDTYDDYDYARLRFLILVVEDVPQAGIAVYFWMRGQDTISAIIVIFAGLRILHGFYVRRRVLVDCLCEAEQVDAPADDQKATGREPGEPAGEAGEAAEEEGRAAVVRVEMGKSSSMETATAGPIAPQQPQQQQQPQQSVPTRFCPACGTKVASANDAFCRGCGQKMK